MEVGLQGEYTGEDKVGRSRGSDQCWLSSLSFCLPAFVFTIPKCLWFSSLVQLRPPRLDCRRGRRCLCFGSGRHRPKTGAEGAATTTTTTAAAAVAAAAAAVSADFRFETRPDEADQRDGGSGGGGGGADDDNRHKEEEWQ